MVNYTPMPIATDRIAIVAGALSNDPRETARLARMDGFAGLLFDAYAPGLSLPDLSQSGRREFRHILSSQDRQLVGLRMDLGARGFSPGADVDQALSRLGRAMEVAASLQAPLLCVDVGPLPEPPPAPKPKPRVTPQQAGLILLPETLVAAPDADATHQQPVPDAIDPNFAAQVDGALAELGRAADRYSVVVALRSELASFSALDRALGAARCPWFGIDLDPVAILRDAWNMDEVFSRLGPLVRHLRARDATLGADRRTRPAVVGQGSTDWPALAARLDESACRGWLTIDPVDLQDRRPAALAALAHLKNG